MAFESIVQLWETVVPVLQFIIQVAIIAAFIYVALLFMRGTRAAPILLGIIMTATFLWFLALVLGLEVISFMLEKLFALLALTILIIFQPELRRAFAEIGSNPYRLLRTSEKEEKTIDSLIDSAFHLASRRIGALIVIERDIGIRSIVESGIRVGAPLSSELLICIFYPNNPLHDGATVIRNGMIVASHCFLPGSQAPISRSLGTRHRAGIGITEETDALAVIVSEESGTVSLAYRGRLVQNVEQERLRRHLTNFLIKKKAPKKAPRKSDGDPV